MYRLVSFGLLVLCASVGCASRQSGDDDDISIPLTSSTVEARTPTPEESAKAGDLDASTLEMIEVALKRGDDKSNQCNKVAGTSIEGEGVVDILVDGQIGKVIDATVGAPFAGTPIEACIKRSFIDEYALRFEGQKKIPHKLVLKAPSKTDPKKDPKKTDPKKK